MTPQTSPPVRAESPAGGVVPQPIPEGQTKVGAFDVPKPSKQAVSTAIQEGKTVPAPVQSSVTLNPATGQTQASTQEAKIPDVKMGAPTVIQQSKTPPKPGWQTAVATFVADGDTAKFTTGNGENVTCRVHGIDAPETAKKKTGDPGQPYGDAARKRLEDLIARKEVNLKISFPEKEGDNYGRAMCQIEVEGKDVSATMVQEGLAMMYDKFVVSSNLKKLERSAKKDRVGLWSDPDPIKPYIHRRVYKSND